MTEPPAFRFGYFDDTDSEPETNAGALTAAPSANVEALRKRLLHTVQTTAVALSDKPRIGLDNLGNTCYVGAIVQALMACPGFPTLLREAAVADDDPLVLPPMLRAMCALVCTEETRNLEVLALSRQFAGEAGIGRMHDASEFLDWLINGLHAEQQPCSSAVDSDRGGGDVGNDDDEWTDVSHARHHKVNKSGLRGEKTFVSTLFQGTSLSVLSASNSNKASITQEPFLMLALHIDNPAIKTVHDCLVSLGAPEFVGSGQKTIELDELPRVLMFQVLRYKFDQRKNKTVKITKTLSVPLSLTLPMGLICDKRRKILELGARNAHAVAAANPLPSPASYALVAVLKHVGEAANTGHYTTLARTQANAWYLYDDRTVQRVPDIQPTTTALLSPDAYVLFYVRNWNLHFADAL